MSDEPTLTTDATLPGARIAQVREGAGLSVADLAAAIKVTTSVVKALEANDYDSLPGLPFVRGYLLNTQKALGLTDADVMDPFNRWRVASGNMQTVSVAEPGAMSAPLRQHPVRRYIKFAPYVIGLIVVLLIIRFDVVGNIADWLVPPPEVSKSATRAVPPVEAEPDFEPLIVEPSLALPDVEVAPLPDDAINEASAQSVAVTAVEASAPVVSDDTDTPAVAAHNLVMRFSDDSWIEVREGGTLLMGALKTKGDAVEFAGDGPFDVLVGSVKATQLVFDGNVLDLTERASQNVARISLP
ncbi:RodZ domain-containing protein [Litorivicinus lipolyticus]|uniref:RodZ domain-containing protein n=1 Tax=Litorivicinus lipolyticus TaxID=418701 RepID=UPI003B5B13E5